MAGVRDMYLSNSAEHFISQEKTAKTNAMAY